MTIEAQARIVLRGGSEALKQLQGVTRGTQAASKAQQQAAKSDGAVQKQMVRDHQARMKASDAASKASSRASAQEQRDAQKSAAARAKAAQDAQRAEERAAAVVQKLQEQQAQRWQQMAQKSAGVRMKADAQVTAAAQREAAKQEQIAQKTAAAQVDAARKRNRDMGGLLGAVGGGLLAGGLQAVNVAKSTTGARGLQERIQASNSFRERLVRVTNDAGMTPEQREGVQEKVIAASKSTGMDIGDLAGVLETGQGQFNNLPYFAEQLENIGRIAKAGGADAQDLAKAIGFANQAFEITGKAAEDSGFLMKAAANKGAVELSDLATSFAPLASTYAETTKHTGQRGLNEFLGLAEAMGTSGFTGERGATRVQGFLAKVGDVDVQKDLEKKAGIRRSSWVGKDGTLDIPGLVRQLASSRGWKDASTRQDIFKDIRAQQGAEGLVNAERRTRAGVENAVSVDTFLGLTSEGGRASVDAGMNAMQKEGFFKEQVKNAGMQTDTLANLETFNGQLGFVTDAANALEKQFGSLSLGVSTLGATIAGFLGTRLLSGALTGGKDAAPAVLEAGTTAAESASKLGFFGRAVSAGRSVLGGGAAGGGGMFMADAATRFADLSSGARSPEGLWDEWTMAAGNWLESTRARGGSDTAATGAGGGTREIVDAIKAGTRETKELNQGVRALVTKAPPSAPREPR